MQAIINFFSGIVDAVSAALDFLIGIVKDLVYVIQLTGKFLLQLPSYFSFLPSQLVSMVLLIFSIVVIYKILGREG